MNIILHYVDHTNLIDGNTLTVLDLFFFLQKKVKMKCVFFIDCDINLNFLYNLIKSRYNLDNISTKNLYWIDVPPQLKCPKFIKYIMYKYNNIICTDATYNRLVTRNIKLISNKILILNSWFSFYNKNNYQDNCIIFNENTLCGEVNYRKKIYFDVIKNNDTIINDNISMFILANGERRLTQEELDEIKDKYNSYNLILCQDRIENLDISGYTLYKVGQPLFSYSDYLYVPTKTYEFAPRMLVESKYLNKNIHYYKYPENFSQRFQDVLDNNINKYKLDETDEIVQYILGGK